MSSHVNHKMFGRGSSPWSSSVLLVASITANPTLSPIRTGNNGFRMAESPRYAGHNVSTGI
jgi:hypothetical protein